MSFQPEDLYSTDRENFLNLGDRDRLDQALALHEYLITQQTLKNRFIRVLKQNQLGSSQPIFMIREYEVI